MFRGVTKEGKVVHGWHVKCRRHHYILPLHNDEQGFDERWIQEGASEDGWFEVTKESLAMKTGVQDKHKVDIYGSFEVDGVMSRGGDKIEWWDDNDWNKSNVVYHDAGFFPLCDCELVFEEIEIIGTLPEGE